MSLNLANYESKVRQAIKAFWGNRYVARQKQMEAGKQDQGERASVTAGNNMDGFIVLVQELIKRNGLPQAEVKLKRRALTLPGYFRPTKLWDLLVINQGRLIAAIEFKSQVGSFGNNFNNRTEEAIGTAVDFWTAYREKAFGDITRPFLGWLMLVEDAPRSRSPVRDASPNFPVLPEFQNASYVERYDIFCKKLVLEQLYSTATILVSPRTGMETGKYSNISEMTSLKTFVTNFAGHIAAEAAREN